MKKSIAKKCSYQNQNFLYVSLKNSNTNKYESIKIDMENIDFSKDNDQFTSISSIDDFMVNKKINSISSISNNSSNSSPTAVINHIVNDITSMRIEFNKIMNYSDVESKVSIIDNSTNVTLGDVNFEESKRMDDGSTIMNQE